MTGEPPDLSAALRRRAELSLPKTQGKVRVHGLREPVEIVRDRWGVPHVAAAGVADAYFTQGYLVGQERLFQIDITFRAATGRLSALLGDLLLPLDRFARTVGWNRAGRRIAETWDDLSHEIAGAWIAGLLAAVEGMEATPVEYAILETEPEIPTGEDAKAAIASAAVLMSWTLCNNFDGELLRLAIGEKLGWEAMASLFPELPPLPPTANPGKRGGEGYGRAALDLLRAMPQVPPGQGSNAWVVSGTRTGTGKPLLANDPHLSLSTPSTWYECHLRAPGFEVSGVCLPYSPGIPIGHTASTAWGFTNVGGDTQDLFLERVDAEGTATLYEGSWEPMKIHREEISVRGRKEPVTVLARETRHGPLIDSYLIGIATPEVVEGGITESYALRWTGYEEAVQPSVPHRLALAKDFASFREAARGWLCPGQNMIFADSDGDIGYQCTGTYPIRKRGDGTLPVPGWSREFEWEGTVPFEELPWAFNPEEGLLVTANQRPHDDSYRYLIGQHFLPPFRARRIVEMITEHERHSLETFAGMQSDTSCPAARAVVEHLIAIEPADARQQEALSYLAGWNHDISAGSVAACIYEVWCVRIAERTLRPALGDELFTHYYSRRQWTNVFTLQVLPDLLAGPTATWFGGEGTEARDEVLRESLADAIAELTSRLGPDMSQWRWGALHRARFRGRLSMVAEAATLLEAGDVAIGGDAHTVCATNFEPGVGYDAVVTPSWRQIVDLSDIDASLGVHAPGQSGNPASSHWGDLTETWSKGGYHPLPFTRAAIEEHAEDRLSLVPG